MPPSVPADLRRDVLNGCPWHDVKSMLRDVGLRPTRQRMALGWILFAKGDRHLTAEMLYEEATKAKVPVSLATVYNTLHQFTEVGLLRQVAVDGSKTYFDTNTTAHHHFFVEGDNALVDIPGAEELREQDARRSGRLRDRPRRRGGPAAQEGRPPVTSAHIGFATAGPLPGRLLLMHFAACRHRTTRLMRHHAGRHRCAVPAADERVMDQAAIDEVAKTFMRARQTGERLDALPRASRAEKLRRFLRRHGRGRQARRRAHRRHQDRRQARRRSGLRAARRGPRFHQPGARAARADAVPVHGMRDQLPPDARSAGARRALYRSTKCSTRWKAAPRSSWSTAASAI